MPLLPFSDASPPTTNASLLTSGTLANARLSSNVPLIASANSFTAGQSITASANTSALTATYSVTEANTTPLLDLSGTWNTSGVATGIKLNITDTASAATSKLLDLQVGGTSKAYIDKNGSIWSFADTPAYTLSMGLTNYERLAFAPAAGQSCFLQLPSGGAYTWTVGYAKTTKDLFLYRDAANTLALRNGTNAQLFRIYNTFTDASNYERGFMRWNSNRLEIGTEFGGTGVARSLAIQLGTSTTPLVFTANGSSGVDITAVRSMSFGSGTTIGPGSVITGLTTINYASGTADPTTTTITNGNWQVYRNTTTGVVRLWANNNGTLVSMTLV